MQNKRSFPLLVLLLVVALCGSSAWATKPRGVITGFTPEVMAPLIIPGIVTNNSGQSYQYTWDLFNQHLTALEAIGVEAVTVNVWWGLVEKTRDQYDWSYYDQLFQYITDAGLIIHPTISFHSVGGNVGDTYDCPLPAWIWEVAGDGGKYINELNNPGNDEVVSLWAENSDAVNSEYSEFMQEFMSHFDTYVDEIEEIGISLGPEGEWRYPSYNVYSVNGQEYGRGYPTRGYLYCYSDQAKASFIEQMMVKYSTILSLNQAWDTNLSSFDQVSPPTNGDGFFNINDSTAYINSQYGRDFIDWYHGQMVEHGKTMLNLAIRAFGGLFSSVPLGIKIPAVHWTAGGYDAASNYANDMPRSAEICAGILGSNFTPDVADNGCGPGYAQSMEMIATLRQSSGREIIVHFTGLGMANDNVASAYSMPTALAFGVGKQAVNNGLTIMGENALAPNNGSNWNKDNFWWNINNAISYSVYSGINIRWIFNVVDSAQKSNYQELIKTHKEPLATPVPSRQ